MSKPNKPNAPVSSAPQQAQRVTRRQLDALAEVLLQVLSFRYPADQVLSRYFRSHRELGRGDRRMMAETIYAGLRHYYRIKSQLQGETGARWFALAALLGPRGYSVASLDKVLSPAELSWAKALRAQPVGTELWQQAELPPWVVQQLQATYSDADILSLGRALQNPAPLDLRVNTLLTQRDVVLTQLRNEGLDANPTPYADSAIRLTDKPALQEHELFKQGWLEVQDEGSQLVSLLLDPQAGERVVDFCAGAGGKTLHIGALMQGRGRIDAYDVAARRLQRLSPRLARSGLSNVRTIVLSSEHDTQLKKRQAKADRVLVDAPCTGLGTLRRNPDLKFRQSETSLAELGALQRSILAAAARLVKPGGRLVYATCSILPAENQQVVADFLALHANFQRVSVQSLLQARNIDLACGEDLVLLPHQHGCDGFYAAVLERRSDA